MEDKAAQARSAFQKLDADKTGKISRSDLQQSLELLQFDSVTAAEIIKKIDVNDDGIIDYSEFIDLLTSDDAHGQTVLDGFKPSTLPRWMMHKRTDSIRMTSLRKAPEDTNCYLLDAVLQSEIVEVVAGPHNGYVMVRLALTGVQGWVREKYLHECPEGTSEHGRLSSESKTGDHEIRRVELKPGDKRFRDVAKHLRESSEGNLAAEKVWFITGHFLGETGMKNGPKETLFHGTNEDVVDSIIQTGFDDEYSADGKFGPGLYFSPEAMTSYGYGSELFLCEVSLGTEEQRITATECSSEHNWKNLLESGKRSVQCHKEDFGQEERIVYHCTQCKPVYVIKVKEVETTLPRWMRHYRADGINASSLRKAPTDAKDYVGSSALQNEIVEVMDRGIPTNGYIYVKLALSEAEGWIKAEYLHTCPEGTNDHGRLAAEGREVELTELSNSSSRVRELQAAITKSLCTNSACRCYGVDIQIKKVTQISGQFLGETGMVTGPKCTLFHGCPDDVVQEIAQKGFDDHFSSGGAFGKGLYFSPQACKAFSYAENYLLVCEVALGSEANRLTVTQPMYDACYETVFVEQHKRSLQCHAGAPFNHEERVVYHCTQCKPVYIIETTTTSPGGGV